MKRWSIVLGVGLAVILTMTVIATRMPPYVPTTTTTVTTPTTIVSSQPTTITSEQTQVVTATTKVNRTTTTTITSSTTKFVTMTAGSSECRMHYPQGNSTDSMLPNGTKITEVKFPVLFLSLGIEGRICVRYSNVVPTRTTNANASGEIVSNGKVSGRVLIGANASQLLVINNGTQTILYGIVASSEAKGALAVQPAQFCVGLPLAVGYSADQLNSTSFAWLVGPRACGLISLDVQIIGYDNMNVVIMTLDMKR